MLLLTVGLNHNTAPIEILERVASGLSPPEKALASLRDRVDGGVVLSTCNRTEVYVVGSERKSAEQKIKSFLCTKSSLSSSELSPHLYKHHNEVAVKHLFKVASGLDSMIVGEFEILGQVRQALETAQKTKLASAPLIKLFRQAVWVGRRAREQTTISRNAASISSAGLELARKVFPDLSTCRALIIGAGEAGKLSVKMLSEYKVSQMMIASRTYDRALALASALGGGAIPMASITEALNTSDMVISCTGSPHSILKTETVAEAMKLRSDRPLVIIDIAVPRDVNPEVRNIKNVFLYDIDDIKLLSESYRKQREKEIERVTSIVDTEVTKFMSWWNSLESLPTIAALVKKADEIRQDQLTKTLGKLPDLSEEDRSKIEAMTKSIVSRLLHNPILCMKDVDKGSEHTEVVQKLFKLRDLSDRK